MVRAWYLNLDIKNVKEMNLTLPPQYVALEDLHNLCHAEFFEANGLEDVNKFLEEKEFKHEMNYTEFVGNELSSTYNEHILTDDVYYVTLKGSGYLDLRDFNNQWIRIEMVEKDILWVKKHALRRFTEDENELYDGKICSKDGKIKSYAAVRSATSLKNSK